MTNGMDFEFHELLQSLTETLNQQKSMGLPDLTYCLEGNLKVDLQSIIRENGYPIRMSQNKADLVHALHEQITEAFEAFLDTILLDREFPLLVQLCFDNGSTKTDADLAAFSEIAGAGFMYFEEKYNGGLMIFPVDLMTRFLARFNEGHIKDMFIRTAYNRFLEGVVNTFGSYPYDRLIELFDAAFSEEMEQHILDQLLRRERTDFLSYFVRDGALLHGGLKDPERYARFTEGLVQDLPYYALSLKDVLAAGAHAFDMEAPVVRSLLDFFMEVTDSQFETTFFLWHLTLMAKLDEPPETLHQFFKDTDLRFTSRQEIMKIFKLYEVYVNQVRKWTLRGHTKKEADMLLARKSELAKPARKRRARPNTHTS